jgi:hypothetical protein
LGPQTRDRVGASPDIQLQVFSIDLDLSRPVLERFYARHRGGKLGIEILPLQGQRVNLVLDLPDFLPSILQDQQLFQFGVHEPEGY